MMLTNLKLNLQSVPGYNMNNAQYAQLLQQMASGGLQMNRAPAYQGQLQQAQMENLVFSNELSNAHSMMNQLNRLMPNAAASNMLVPNLGTANFAQNSRVPYVAPQAVPTARTMNTPVLVPDDDISIIPDPVPSTSAGNAFY
jgi:hypothetical protein